MARSTSSSKPQSTKKPQTLGELADTLFTLRDKKAKIAQLIKEVEQEIDEAEGKFLAACEEQGTTVARGALAQVSIKKVEVPQVSDWDAVFKYIIRHKAPHLLQRRIHQGALDELVQSEGPKFMLPGVNMVSIDRIHITSV